MIAKHHLSRQGSFCNYNSHHTFISRLPSNRGQIQINLTGKGWTRLVHPARDLVLHTGDVLAELFHVHTGGVVDLPLTRDIFEGVKISRGVVGVQHSDEGRRVLLRSRRVPGTLTDEDVVRVHLTPAVISGH